MKDVSLTRAWFTLRSVDLNPAATRRQRTLITLATAGTAIAVAMLLDPVAGAVLFGLGLFVAWNPRRVTRGNRRAFFALLVLVVWLAVIGKAVALNFAAPVTLAAGIAVWFLWSR